MSMSLISSLTNSATSQLLDYRIYFQQQRCVPEQGKSNFAWVHVDSLVCSMVVFMVCWWFCIVLFCESYEFVCFSVLFCESIGCVHEVYNAEGCWGFLYLKIEKLANAHFMFFDRYEMHIQYFVDLFNHVYNLPILIFINFDKQWGTQISSKKQTNEHTAHKTLTTNGSHIYKHNIFKNSSGSFLICLGVLVSPKIHNFGIGAWWRVKKPRNHEI